MLTSKQRAQLRGMANAIDTIFQVGKGGIGEAMLAQIKDALRVRELIKLRVLENADYSAREAAEEIAAAVEADVVCVIGSRFVLYKPNPQKPIIELVDSKPKSKGTRK